MDVTIESKEGQRYFTIDISANDVNELLLDNPILGSVSNSVERLQFMLFPGAQLQYFSALPEGPGYYGMISYDLPMMPEMPTAQDYDLLSAQVEENLKTSITKSINIPMIIQERTVGYVTLRLT